VNALLKDTDPKRLLLRFGGITLLERHLHLLKRAGARRVHIAATRPETGGLRFPDGLEIRWTSAPPEAPVLVLSADYLLRRKKLEALARRPGAYRSPDGRELLRVEPVHGDPITLDADDFLRLDKGTPDPSWLLPEARKDTDSFMAKHFDRRISLAATRLLLDTPVSPTQMTLFSCLVGLAGALMLAQGSFSWLLAGALIIWLHTLFDGCDGELARIRYQESRLGGQIDFWGDNLIHFTLFTALGIGRWRMTGELTLLALGLVAGLSSLVAALLVYRHTAKQEKMRAPGGPLFRGVAAIAAPGAGRVRTLLARVEDTLTQRDFIYLFVFLAVLDKLDAFLWLAGVGTPLFALIFLALQIAFEKQE
jgi:phosphatidylglycerophosphate synthase